MLYPKKGMIFPLSYSAFPLGPGTTEEILTAVKETLFFNLIRETAERIRSARDTDVLAYSDGLQSAPTHSLHHTLSHSPENQQVC